MDIEKKIGVAFSHMPINGEFLLTEYQKYFQYKNSTELITVVKNVSIFCKHEGLIEPTRVSTEGEWVKLTDRGRLLRNYKSWSKLISNETLALEANNTKNMKERYWILVGFIGWFSGVATTIAVEVLKPQAVLTLKHLIGIQ